MADDAGSRLGAAIRARRKALGMTIVQLADRADLSHPFVSQVERGRANPSFDSLARIAHALGTSQVELMSGTALDESSARAGTFGGSEARMLTSGDTRFSVIDITGSALTLGDYYQHPEDEFVTVLSGIVDVDLGGAVEALRTGESRYVTSGTPHRWASHDGAAYRLLVVKERIHTPSATAASPGEES